MAAEALQTAAAAVRGARGPLRQIASAAPGVPACHSPDALFQTVAAAGAPPPPPSLAPHAQGLLMQSHWSGEA